MVKYWHFNCGGEENLSHMYPRNMAYIGIADSNLQYEERIKKSGTTPKQIANFENKANIGDIILLYQSKVGYIAYGYYNGRVLEPTNREEEAPRWPPGTIQKHVEVDEWKSIRNPMLKYFYRQTLCQIQKNSQMIFEEVCTN